MRITNEMRQDIIDKCVKDTFAKRTAALAAARTKLADALYTREYGKVAALVAKLPDGWVNYYSELSIKHPDFTHRNRYSTLGLDTPPEASARFKMTKSQPWPLHKPDVTVDKAHPLYDRAKALATTDIELENERRALRSKLITLLASVTTDKQLQETWPAGKKWFPAFDPPVRAMVPVSLVAEVNAIVGTK